MFDFEKLTVYQKAKQFRLETKKLLISCQTDIYTIRQLQRASLSVPINIAESAGRYTNLDKRKFYIIARGSLYESVALLELLVDEGAVDKEKFASLSELATEISKMLWKLIKQLSR